MLKGAFLDRDGVINIDRGYVYRWEDFEFIAGAIEGLRALQRLEYQLVIVTNQSGVARGYYTIEDVNELSAKIVAHLHAEGVVIAGIYCCPHHPAGNVAEFARSCECRKPRPGMLIQARDDLGLDLSRSVLIGDKLSDIEAARNAGVSEAFLVGAGEGGGEKSPTKNNYGDGFPSLLDCARFLSRG